MVDHESNQDVAPNDQTLDCECVCYYCLLVFCVVLFLFLFYFLFLFFYFFIFLFFGGMFYVVFCVCVCVCGFFFFFLGGVWFLSFFVDFCSCLLFVVFLFFFSLMKEGNVLFNDALNTFYLRLYGVRHNYGKEPLIWRERKRFGLDLNIMYETFYSSTRTTPL